MYEANTDLLFEQFIKQLEDEKKYISCEVLEHINHELVSLKKNTQENTDTDRKIDSIIGQIRKVSSELRPVLFEEVGLKISIEQFIQPLQDKHDLFITTDIRYKKELGKDHELQIYRIIQAALWDIISRAKAKAVKISVVSQPGEVLVTLKDNSFRFERENELRKAYNPGGLSVIIARSKAIGGKTMIQSGNDGTSLMISIPIPLKK
ncbi:MAG: hypothetical protein K1X92_02380 [Bacteroidia bacterium]|nr:hypothetical protein [Bacteroidia bacterium]